MKVKFRITCEDGTIIDSHDDSWNPIKDHAHALAPHNTSKWREYELICENGNTVSCIFPSGCFKVNGTLVHPADEYGAAYTFKEEPQNFPVTEQWEFLNGLPYFPVVGRRTFAGEWGGVTLSFCGWKRMEKDQYGKDKLVEKLALFHDNGQIILT